MRTEGNTVTMGQETSVALGATAYAHEMMCLFEYSAR